MIARAGFIDRSAAVVGAVVPVGLAAVLLLVPLAGDGVGDVTEDVAGGVVTEAAGVSAGRPAGVVLLSPAASSFGQFRDYKDRERVFAEAMRRWAAGG